MVVPRAHRIILRPRGGGGSANPDRLGAPSPMSHGRQEHRRGRGAARGVQHGQGAAGPAIGAALVVGHPRSGQTWMVRPTRTGVAVAINVSVASGPEMAGVELDPDDLSVAARAAGPHPSWPPTRPRGRRCRHAGSRRAGGLLRSPGSDSTTFSGVASTTVTSRTSWMPPGNGEGACGPGEPPALCSVVMAGQPREPSATRFPGPAATCKKAGAGPYGSAVMAPTGDGLVDLRSDTVTRPTEIMRQTITAPATLAFITFIFIHVQGLSVLYRSLRRRTPGEHHGSEGSPHPAPGKPPADGDAGHRRPEVSAIRNSPSPRHDLDGSAVSVELRAASVQGQRSVVGTFRCGPRCW